MILIVFNSWYFDSGQGVLAGASVFGIGALCTTV